jgi:hypothetical protein
VDCRVKRPSNDALSFVWQAKVNPTGQATLGELIKGQLERVAIGENLPS